MKFHYAWLVLLLLGTVLSPAQTLKTTPMIARFFPGQSMRYEFDGIVHFTAGHARNVKLNILENCSYNLHSVLRFDFGQSNPDGALSGRIHFQALQLSGWACGNPPRPELVKALQNLETNGIEFQINPGGDVRFKKFATSGAEYEGVSMLLKSAWGLLQTRLSDQALSPEPRWFASRRFLYWPDTFMDGMEVAAASMQYGRDVTLADQPFAWLQYKQVFSPTDMPAYVETRTRARDFTGTTFVTGKGNVSLLFDHISQRIVYLHHTRSIDNRMMLKYESSETSAPVATYSVEEESSVRWLPEKNSESWLAELHKFETEPEPIPIKQGPVNTSNAEQSLAEVAAASRRKNLATEDHEHQELSDLVDRVPRGFERWSKNYCSGGYCFDLSIAVPDGTKVADSTDTTVLLLSSFGEHTITLAIGPILDRQYEGLGEEELLQKQTTNFVTNYLWFAGGPGKKLNFENSVLRDRPAAFSDFISKARDLTPIRGRLVMLITPYDRLAPVICSYPASLQETSDPICQTVTESVLIH